MKLGIAYNIFNGDELLIDSLERLRTVSEYIVLTYQDISNVGNISKSNLLEKLSMIDKSLFDDIVLFNPSLKLSPQENETKKRNLGLKYAKKNKCTHFMSVDCDEFYDLKQFSKAKEEIIRNGYKSTACELVNYFHSSKYQMIENKQYVPFIFKISYFKKHKIYRKLPVVVDPTRVIRNDSFHCFDSNKLIMHHMSYVRVNYESIKSKLYNSPNKHLFNTILTKYLEYYNNWNPKQLALNPHHFKDAKNLNSKNTLLIEKAIPLRVEYQKK